MLSSCGQPSPGRIRLKSPAVRAAAEAGLTGCKTRSTVLIGTPLATATRAFRSDPDIPTVL